MTTATTTTATTTTDRPTLRWRKIDGARQALGGYRAARISKSSWELTTPKGSSSHRRLQDAQAAADLVYQATIDNWDGPTTVVLSYGLGVDSTEILRRWILEPASRDFDLADLVVLTAHVGDEFAATYDLVDEHVLPLLAAHGVRFVQIARRGPSLSDGIVVLQDTREPQRLVRGIGYTLHQDLLEAGTAPTKGAGGRTCSIHFKGEPLDAWISKNVDGPYRHVIGFNSEEADRAARDSSYGAGIPASPPRIWQLSDELLDSGVVPTKGCDGHTCSIKFKVEPLTDWIESELHGRPVRLVLGYAADETKRADDVARHVQPHRLHDYPLIQWGADRAECEAKLAAWAGRPWLKSCCTYCPFANGKLAHVARLRQDPAAAGQALLIEFVALAMNPRMALYESRTLHDCIQRDGNQAALDTIQAELDGQAWAVYRVRRVYSGKGKAARAVHYLRAGHAPQMDRGQAERTVRRVAAATGLDLEDGLHVRAYRHRRPDQVEPGTVEEFLVACPQLPREKVGLADFDAKWDAATAALELQAAG